MHIFLEINGSCSNKPFYESNSNKDKELSLSSHLCENSYVAKLGDLLWYQGDKRLCTIYPQVRLTLNTQKYLRICWFAVVNKSFII